MGALTQRYLFALDPVQQERDKGKSERTISAWVFRIDRDTAEQQQGDVNGNCYR